MWSLFRRSVPSVATSSGQPAEAVPDTLAQLFQLLLDQVQDQAVKAAFTKQFQDEHSTSSTLLQSKLAPVFQQVITYLLEHQPPATKTTLTKEAIHSLITDHVSVQMLEPELMGVLATGPLQLAGILGIGVSRLADTYFASLSQVAAREGLDKLLEHLPYQVPPDLYSELTASQVPSVKPLLFPLSVLGRADLLANMRYMYQYFIDALLKNNQQPQAVKSMQEVYTYISQTYPQELTLTFLDLVPAGWLEQERGNLLGREELLKVLDQLQAEKAKIEAINVRDEALLTSIGDGVVAVDQQGKVIFVNQSAVDMLGLQKADLASVNWFEEISLVDSNDTSVPKNRRPMIQAITTQQRIVTNDLTFVRTDNTKLPVAITATPYMVSGQMSGAILVFKDMTHEREVDRQKTEFISVASHQLRTPLGSMRWNLEMLSKGYYGAITPETADVLQQTLAVNDHTIKLVNTLLNISRIEAGRVQDHASEVNVNELLDVILQEVQPLAQEKQVTINVEKPQTSPVILIDSSRLREVFENVIANAIKYSFPKGQVAINLKQNDAHVVLEVADQGMGIPQKEQFKVFSRFFRAENALNNEPNGSGFGLFIVKSYIEGWGGKIWFKSPTLPDDKGTTFYLQIPLQVQTPANGLYLESSETTSEANLPVPQEKPL